MIDRPVGDRNPRDDKRAYGDRISAGRPGCPGRPAGPRRAGTRICSTGDRDRGSDRDFTGPKGHRGDRFDRPRTDRADIGRSGGRTITATPRTVATGPPTATRSAHRPSATSGDRAHTSDSPADRGRPHDRRPAADRLRGQSQRRTVGGWRQRPGPWFARRRRDGRSRHPDTRPPADRPHRTVRPPARPWCRRQPRPAGTARAGPPPPAKAGADRRAAGSRDRVPPARRRHRRNLARPARMGDRPTHWTPTPVATCAG